MGYVGGKADHNRTDSQSSCDRVKATHEQENFKSRTRNASLALAVADNRQSPTQISANVADSYVSYLTI